MAIPSDDDRFALPRDIPALRQAQGDRDSDNLLRQAQDEREHGAPSEDWRARGLAHPAGRGWAADPLSGREQGARLIAEYGHELRPPRRIAGDPPVEYVDADALEFFAPGPGPGPGAALAKFGRAGRVRFLDCLAACGEVRASAARAGVSRETVYRARRRCPEFARLWDAALVHARARAEGELLTRALDGVKVPVFHGGECVATWRKHDARYLLALLARLDRRVDEDPAAVLLAERFDEALAALAGHAAPPDFAAAAEAVRGYDEAEDCAGLPPTREEYAAFHRSEAIAACAATRAGRADEEAEARAMDAAGEAALAAHDAWREAGFAALDALLEAPPAHGDEDEDGEESPPQPRAPAPAPTAAADAGAGAAGSGAGQADRVERPHDPPFEVKSARPLPVAGAARSVRGACQPCQHPAAAAAAARPRRPEAPAAGLRDPGISPARETSRPAVHCLW